MSLDDPVAVKGLREISGLLKEHPRILAEERGAAPIGAAIRTLDNSEFEEIKTLQPSGSTVTLLDGRSH